MVTALSRFAFGSATGTVTAIMAARAAIQSTRPLLPALIFALAVHGSDTSGRNDPQLVRAAAIVVSVVDDAGVPLAAARVMLTGQSHPLHLVVAADERGRATFSDLPAGSYGVAADKSGYVQSAFGQQGAIAAVVIVLTAYERFEARITLGRTGSISGTITSERGEGTPALVRLHQFGREQGRRTLKPLVASRTDAQGLYRIDSLAPGEYLVSGGDEALPIFYPGVGEPALATPVRVVPGNITAGIGITISTSPPGRFEGLVLNVDGQPAGATRVHITRADELDGGGILARVNGAGEFRASVPPGTYRLMSETGGRAEAAAVSGVSTPVTLRDGRTATMSARVEYAGDRATDRFGAGGVIGQLRAPGRPFVIPLAFEENARTLRTTPVPAGDYLLELSRSNWTLEMLSINGRPIVDTVLRVEPDQLLTLVLTFGRPAQLDGTVIDSRQLPRYDHQILVFPAESRYWIADSPRIRVLQPDTKGRFSVGDLPQGVYLLAAIEGLTSGWDPALLQAAAAGAVRVRLERGAQMVQNVMLAK